MRVLGIDLGDARVGLAMSDRGGVIASPFEVLKRTKNLHSEIAALVDEYEVARVVVGLPLSLDGSTGPAAVKVLAEVDRMGDTLNVPVETYDERLSTVTAERALKEANLDGRKRRTVVDKIAAAVILQAWLDRQHTQTPDWQNSDIDE